MGTRLDTQNKLNKFTDNQLSQMAVKATQFAGHMALRLVHDHLLRLDLTHYDMVIRAQVASIKRRIQTVRDVSVFFFSAISITDMFCCLAHRINRNSWLCLVHAEEAPAVPSEPDG